MSAPSWNVAPTDDVWAVTARSDETGDLIRRLRRYRWGLVPSWSKSPAAGARSINARAETVMDKPMFRNALERRRCIVPADAFYEWQRRAAATSGAGVGVGAGAVAGGGRRGAAQPWCFRRPDGGILAFAGLWEFWRERSPVHRRGSSHRDGEPVLTESDSLPFLVSCTIITTDANDVVAPIHDRMPVVLPRESWADWLAPGGLATDLLVELFMPAPEGSLIGYRVAPVVNDVRNNGPDLILPYEGDDDFPPTDRRREDGERGMKGPARTADSAERLVGPARGHPGPSAAQLFDPADLA